MCRLGAHTLSHYTFSTVQIWFVNVTKYQKRTSRQSSKVGGSKNGIDLGMTFFQSFFCQASMRLEVQFPVSEFPYDTLLPQGD